MNDMRGLGDIQPSCSGQEMPQDVSHQNMPQHHPDINGDIDQDIGRELNHEIRHHQNTQGDYFSSQVSMSRFFAKAKDEGFQLVHDGRTWLNNFSKNQWFLQEPEGGTLLSIQVYNLK